MQKGYQKSNFISKIIYVRLIDFNDIVNCIHCIFIFTVFVELHFFCFYGEKVILHMVIWYQVFLPNRNVFK